MKEGDDMDKVWWIWVKIKSTGKERWAKDNDGTVPPVTLDDAINMCGRWNQSAQKHEYSVRRYVQPNTVKVMVEVNVPRVEEE